MDDPLTEIEEKQQLLTDLEARLQALGRIKRELSAQAQILQHQIAELKKSGIQAVPASGKERRSSRRRQGNLIPVTITEAASPASSLEQAGEGAAALPACPKH